MKRSGGPFHTGLISPNQQGFRLMPKITVGLPVFNGEKTIRSALDSLTKQSCTDLVIIISDNGSTDATETICREYANQDPRIRYVRQNVNLGAAMNFRFVLFEAQTPYFMWAAADELWATAFVATHLAVLERDPGAVACQSRVLFTVDGIVSHLSTGTYALPDDPRRNVARFLQNPADNSRYYGLFRTAALQAVFPTRSFFALDWAVSAATLRFGTHVEIPDVLMIRDSSDARSYERSVGRDHKSLLCRIFPLLFMTRWLLRGHMMPVSAASLRALFKLNLYMHFRFGLYHMGRLAEVYLQTNSTRATARAALANMVRMVVRPGIKQRVMAAVKRVARTLFSVAHRLWRVLPMTLRQREALKTRAFRLLGRQATLLPSFSGWTGDTMQASERHPALPTSGWRMPSPVLGRTPAAAVVVVAQGNFVGTLALIDSLAAVQRDLPMEIVVVNNGATDVTPFLGDVCSGIVFVSMPCSMSYGEAATAGLTAAAANHLILINESVLVREGFLHNILAALQQAEMVGPRALYPDLRLRSAGGSAIGMSGAEAIGEGESPTNPDFLYAREVDYCTAAFAITRESLNAIGGLSWNYENFEMTSCDTAVRVRAKSGKVLYWPAAVVTDYADDTGRESPGVLRFQSQWRDWMVFKARNDLSRVLPGIQGNNHGLPSDRYRPKRLLFIDAVTPAADQNAGSLFVINLMRMLGSEGFRVTFVPENDFAYQGKYTEKLREQGVHAIHRPFYSSVQEVLEQWGGQFDVV